jgi:hypothetical protein
MTRRKLAGLFVAVAVGAMSIAPARAGEAGVAPHAYYLFLAGAPQSCEDCYVPLLITQRPLEDVSSPGRDGAVLITTYERDSIWKVERGVSLAATHVSAAERRSAPRTAISVSGGHSRRGPATAGEARGHDSHSSDRVDPGQAVAGRPGRSLSRSEVRPPQSRSDLKK